MEREKRKGRMCCKVRMTRKKQEKSEKLDYGRGKNGKERMRCKRRMT
jgi:hypothetical protein